jgi:ribosomal protein S14
VSDALKESYCGWSVLELMGHRRLGGYVTQVELFGTAMLRIDVPGDEHGTIATQFYGGSSIYCLTPTGEAEARAVARNHQPAPVTRWELPAPSEAERSKLECADCGRVVSVELGVMEVLCRNCVGQIAEEAEAFDRAHREDAEDEAGEEDEEDDHLPDRELLDT